MASKKNPTPSANNSISIKGDVKESTVFIGDNNTVNQTIIQKFFNIFKSDSESMEQRNRRILLGHVENAWIKGVLDASLQGAALLDLGIKQDPEAVTKYPWAIQKEATNETLPAGTSMLEIFDSIGMGRSLLILGAPGSGKTTMLLELARQLIARTREDVTYPIPMVFNLASWTEKLSLADWLAQELNNLYSVPRKTAPDWVKGDKLLLLLDGLDEVRQDSRAKCVEAINAFRKEHGLTSLTVCSRSQDYADLKAKLSFEGAIEVQPLRQEQITEFFNRFGEEMTGIKQVLKKDSALREMAETPLFLSIMILAYRDKQDVDILVSGNEKARRKNLFDTYIVRMFERPERSRNEQFNKQDILHWLSWLAQKMIEHDQVLYLLENMQPKWLAQKQRIYRLIFKMVIGLIFGMIIGLFFGLRGNLAFGLIGGLLSGLAVGLFYGLREFEMVDTLTLEWVQVREAILIGIKDGFLFGLIIRLIFGLIFELRIGLVLGSFYVLSSGLIFGLRLGLRAKSISKTAYAGQRIYNSTRNSFIVFIFALLIGELFFSLSIGLSFGLGFIPGFGLSMGLLAGLAFGGGAVIQHYTLRSIIAFNN